MSAFREFEREIVKLLVGRHMREDELTAVLDSANSVSYEHTGVGYFVTVRHPNLPSERTVCDEPMLIGRSGDVDCGFVVFLEGGEMTLECHSWGDTLVPEDFRETQVLLEVSGRGDR